MAFRGLFFGIDRYASPHINWLSCAARDARALHAVFSDMFGAGAALLTDEAATKKAIEKELDRLVRLAPGDFVILSFSGHGTRTHQLVPYDADISNLATTTISLEELANCFAKIPSNRMVYESSTFKRPSRVYGSLKGTRFKLPGEEWSLYLLKWDRTLNQLI